ncbi:MAG: aldehyde dehydrogenase family protein [Thermoanaerobaculia bacterium]|nr:aldehyde dehydrogenase family protein [Thermoanaerobaculia bacterium]
MTNELPPAAMRRLAAWCTAVEVFRDRASSEREALQTPLLAATGLSPAGLDAGLEAVLGGVREPAARRVFLAARDRRLPPEPVLVVLAGNLPALVVQPLLPIVALGRPAILKPASSEPVFTPAFVEVLARHDPSLGELLSVAAWRGGDEVVEAEVLSRVGTVLAYGNEEATTSLARRAPGRTVVYGPKTSVGIVTADAEDLAAVAAGLARDVALFDQRGCLSVSTVFVEQVVAAPLAVALARALDELAVRWPLGRLEPATRAAIHSLRSTADLAGWFRPELPVTAGTVVVVPAGQPFGPGPGGRTVCVQPVASVGAALGGLEPWRGKLQGAALAGGRAWALGPALEALGLSRLAAPGELQAVDDTWFNGGVSPLDVLADGA